MAETSRKILDLTYLIEAADGDSEFISEILGDYLGEMTQQLKDVDQHFADSDLGSLLRSAHTIKGASANVGATRVTATAALLEAQTRKGSVEGGDSLIALLHQEIDRVRELVQREGIEKLLKASA